MPNYLFSVISLKFIITESVSTNACNKKRTMIYYITKVPEPICIETIDIDMFLKISENKRKEVNN